MKSRDWRAEVRRRAVAAGLSLSEGVVEELALHLEDLETDAIAAGATPAEARAHADTFLRSSDLSSLAPWVAKDRRLTRAEIVSRVHRSRGGFTVLDTIRLAVRQLRHHPQLAVIATLVLGLSIGAATTVFSVVDAVILEPLPYERPDRLVSLWDVNVEEGLTEQPMSPVNFLDYRDLPVLEDAAVWWRPGINLIDPGLDPMRVSTIETTDNLFEVLGVAPQVGAGFPSQEPLYVRNEPVVVVSDRLWRQRYGADPDLVGRQLSLNGTAHTVLGVMPPGFHFPDDVDVWQRMGWDPSQHSRSAHFMEAVGRLADGVTLETARSAADTLADRLGQEHPASNGGWATRFVPLLDDTLGYYRPALLVVGGAVFLLLAIAILNVACLLLTRAVSRQREIAIRISAGASPGHLIRQLLAESLVLSVTGAVIGLVSAAVALPLLAALAPVEVPRLESATIDLRVLGVGVGLVLLTTLVFGLVPSHLMIRKQIGSSLRSGERGSSRRTRRLYAGLVAGEVALACSLLVGSVLLVRTVQGMTTTDLGVEADQAVTTLVQIDRSTLGMSRETPDRERWLRTAQAHTDLLDAIRRQPGVRSAGAANFLPFGEGWRVPAGVEGGPVYAEPDDAPEIQLHTVSDGWFETLGATLAAGRSFQPTDDPDAPGVVIVNRAFVEARLGGGPAVGRRVRMWGNGVGPLGRNLKATQDELQDGWLFEIVGVVEDVRNAPLGQRVEPAVYHTSRQFPFSEQYLAVDATTPDRAVAALREGLKEVVPRVPLASVQTWGDHVAERAAEQRLLMGLLSFFGLLAALLAAAGVYGLFSWSVATRRRELAIRMTLGAAPNRVARLIAGQSAVLVTLGLVAGLGLVFASRSVLARVVYGVSPTDIVSTLTAAAVLLAAATLACVPPVLRAMQVDPVRGLRAE